jgi:ADP-heptose:LPS heptosyltransferase
MILTPSTRPVPSSGAGRLRVVVLRSGALGDFVLTIPVLERLRCAAAQVEVVYAGRSSFGAFARTCGLVDDVIGDDAPGFVSLFTASPEAERRARRAFGTFDVAVSYLASDQVTGNLLRAGVSEVWSADPLPPPGGPTHASDHLLAALRPRLATAGARPKVRVPNEFVERAREALASRGVGGRFLLIHPGSGSSRKNWSPDSFGRVAKMARERVGLATVLVTGPVEKEKALPLEAIERVADARFDSPRLTLLAAIASGAACFLGNDSGCSHLAAACGCPTVAVFGPTEPALWAPRGDSVDILGGGGHDVNDVTPECVCDAVCRMIESRD